MKLEKVTEPVSEPDGAPRAAGVKGADKRTWYDDACGTALAMELVGERWSLLIVRELMFGGRRFSELRAGLPSISANVLTQRLESMERVGILQRRKLPPPASVQVYELTKWGYEAEEALQVLGRWAVRSPLHDPTLPLSPASIMMSFRTMYDVEAAGGEQARIGFRFGHEGFVVDFDGDHLVTRRGEPVDCQLVMTTDPMTLGAVIYGGAPVEQMEAAGALKVEGDRTLIERMRSWFPLPCKWTEDAGDAQ